MENQETEIRQLIQRWADATCANDIDAVMGMYTSDVVAFDAIGPLQHRGTEAYRKHWEDTMSVMPPNSQMVLEPQDVVVAVEDRIAFVHYMARCGFIDEAGNQQMGWLRATVCCRRSDDGWRIAHEHYSSPFDPETMKVLPDLEP